MAPSGSGKPADRVRVRIRIRARLRIRVTVRVTVRVRVGVTESLKGAEVVEMIVGRRLRSG